VPLPISSLRVAPQRLAAAAMTAAQNYLLQARQMQALSFSVHIPLVCFGIAFPTLLLFVEWLYLRSGDPLYRTLARRWTNVMVALFAAGVVTGTILSFEMGLLWPAFTATFGSVFGLGFAVEGFSFFLEAIFIGIYVYGWNRLSPRLHFATGIPIALAGFTGSLMVISVNGWMNHPSGFRLSHGKAVDVHPFKALFENAYFWHELIHMYVAGYIVTGFLLAGAYAVLRLRGRWGRYERVGVPKLLSVLAYHRFNAKVQGLDAVPARDRPPVNVVRFAFQTMVGIGTLLALLALVYLAVRIRRRRLPRSTWFYRAVALAGPLSVVALISGWVTTEVGRQPWVVYRVMRTSQAVTGARGIPVGYGTLVLVYVLLIAAVAWILWRLARKPLQLEPSLSAAEVD
jgi:cytochrome bd-type quinol oxidase subunit 1